MERLARKGFSRVGLHPMARGLRDLYQTTKKEGGSRTPEGETELNFLSILPNACLDYGGLGGEGAKKRECRKRRGGQKADSEKDREWILKLGCVRCSGGGDRRGAGGGGGSSAQDRKNQNQRVRDVARMDGQSGRVGIGGGGARRRKRTTNPCLREQAARAGGVAPGKTEKSGRVSEEGREGAGETREGRGEGGFLALGKTEKARSVQPQLSLLLVEATGSDLVHLFTSFFLFCSWCAVLSSVRDVPRVVVEKEGKGT